MSIEVKLRNAARQVRGITLWPTVKGQWQANMTICGSGWVPEIAADPPPAVNRLPARYAPVHQPAPSLDLPALLAQAAHRRGQLTEALRCG